MVGQPNGLGDTLRAATYGSRVITVSLLLTALILKQASAANFPVPDTGNAFSNGAALVAAINAAQTTIGDDIVVLDAGATYSLDHADNSINGLPIITTGITVRGGYTATGALTTISMVRDAEAPGFRVFAVAAAGRLKLDSLRITNGALASGPFTTFYHGTAVRNDGGSVHLFRSELSENVGVAIANMNAGSTGMMTIEESTVRDNRSQVSVAGIYNEGTLTLDRSTVASNSGGEYLGDGGPGGITSTLGDIRIVNSTVSGNQSNGLLGGSGILGGILIRGGRASIEFSTIAMNAGLGIMVYGGDVTVTNSILDRNGVPDPANPFSTVRIDCGGTLTSGGHNILGSASSSAGNCGFIASSTDFVGSETLPFDARLDRLASNGGFTQTHALLPASPAVAAAVDSRGGCPAIDQRNESRPRFPEPCDIGAYQTRGTDCRTNGWCTLEPMALLCASRPNYCRMTILPGIAKYIPMFPPLDRPVLDCRIDGPGCGPWRSEGFPTTRP